MEVFFGRIYGGDSGIPHANPDRFLDIWTGSFLFTGITTMKPCVDKIVSSLPHQFNWQDKAMLSEQKHWKKALKKKQPNKFKWNNILAKNKGTATISTDLSTSFKNP